MVVIDHRDAMEFINCELMLDRPATVMGGWVEGGGRFVV